ncbi:hypothetical protein WA026_018989 [Henosepilachna vigintioctopunctata]|uniref:Uncharacterized protein n=1 Tax=Henosepilachna vigintioctopunctata TaxID=420089 RepID=A0AAW1VIH9_9CUCU
MVLFQTFRTFLKLTSQSVEKHEVMKECPAYEEGGTEPSSDKNCIGKEKKTMITQKEDLISDCDEKKRKREPSSELFAK